MEIPFGGSEYYSNPNSVFNILKQKSRSVQQSKDIIYTQKGGEPSSDEDAPTTIMSSVLTEENSDFSFNKVKEYSTKLKDEFYASNKKKYSFAATDFKPEFPNWILYKKILNERKLARFTERRKNKALVGELSSHRVTRASNEEVTIMAQYIRFVYDLDSNRSRDKLKNEYYLFKLEFVKAYTQFLELQYSDALTSPKTMGNRLALMLAFFRYYKDVIVINKARRMKLRGV